ncbi:bifunctional metallophosphatase/5'-nucleotidase [Thiococcus pfennigii]|uniref:bifunctional metallophosphatase/5'-nucleotidase n=1 Tax=Thiococcus pfennigii TaxID=1057 RepID=UPI001907ECBB|nr:5'-nucleotidase C-terminal domain-containing protein [Thiococcus pfennigii]MBK1730240.1 bifunctional metallophosphatase/5'-nucleotidase [Thiococcus pfennigii]
MTAKVIWRVLFGDLPMAIVLAFAAATPVEARPPHVDLWLTILHSNDGESQLLQAPGHEAFGGIARFRTLVDELRAQATAGVRQPCLNRRDRRAAVVLSSGDNFLTGPEFHASLRRPDGKPFYDAIGLDLIGYDAVAIGNHELDFGPDVLADFIAGFERPVEFLAANLDVSAEPRLAALAADGRIVASTVVFAGCRRIGVIGATTPTLPAISNPRNILVNEVAPAVARELARLRHRDVDKVILISHLQGITEEMALLAELRGIDVAIAGGGHELLANAGDRLVPGDERVPALPYPLFAVDADGQRVPVVTTAGDYKYVGRLEVGFDRAGRIVAIAPGSGPVRVAGGNAPDAVAPDPQVLARVTRPVQAALDRLAEQVLATSEVALDGSRPNIRIRETNLGDLIADALLWQARELAEARAAPPPDVALLNGGGIRNNSVIPAGELTELTTFDILPFANFVTIVPDIPRAQFKEILEKAVANVAGADGAFAQIAGFRFAWDPNGIPQVLDDAGRVLVAGTRVRQVTLDGGEPFVIDGVVQPGAPLTIATIDFLARGGDGYPYRDAAFVNLEVGYRQALADYIVESLAGQISAADYPPGGGGRVTEMSAREQEPALSASPW